MLYMLCPFDFLPEAAFGFLGLADDLFIVGFGLLYLCVALREFMANRGEAGLED